MFWHRLFQVLAAGVLLSSMPAAAAGLVSDVLDCIDGRQLRTDGRCAVIADEALESERLVERLADVMLERKEHLKATAILAAGLRKYPDSGSLRSRLAVANSYADEMEAIAARDRERRARPDADALAASMARIRCTRMSGTVGLEACNAALAREPDDPMLLAAKGDLLAADGRLPEAINMFEAALRARPNDVMVRQKIALLSGRKDRPPAAPVQDPVPSQTPPPEIVAAAPNLPKPSVRPAPGLPTPGARSTPPTATPSAGQPPPANDLEQRLAVLQRLRSSALLSETEFESRRRGLLDAYLSPPLAVASAARASDVTIPPIDFGRYHALVIGINKYRHLPSLDTTHNDARAVAATLKEQYDYDVKLMLDPTREQIIEALDVLRETLTEKDNLLLYYAGHGWLDKEADQGFWLPADARAERRSQWISNDVVRDLAKALKVKHMLVIADSCFSGALTRGLSPPPQRDPSYLQRMASKRARQAMSSGGLEPVFDSVDGKNSPFARTLVKILRENSGVLDGTTLFSELRRPVALSAEQTPEFSDIRRAGHDGGDFLFVRRR